VVPEAKLKLPQAPDGLALVVKVTTSPEPAAPLKLVTVAVTVELFEPLAGSAAETAVTVTLFGRLV
jgi:hypothetical protein